MGIQRVLGDQGVLSQYVTGDLVLDFHEVSVLLVLVLTALLYSQLSYLVGPPNMSPPQGTFSQREQGDMALLSSNSGREGTYYVALG